MGEESRAMVEREFSWTVAIDRQIDLYEELIGGRAVASAGLLQS
jgi:glycosyltransferase involved in cell wall biosynthesis